MGNENNRRNMQAELVHYTECRLYISSKFKLIFECVDMSINKKLRLQIIALLYKYRMYKLI